MLKQLHIRNFAIIDELDLQFASGMTVLTGETGAGKSILIDAIALVLGDRADSSVIRGEEERAEILASFDIGAIPGIIPVLEEQAIQAEDNELTLRRVISRDGRSRAIINSSHVSAQVLKTVGEYLIDIHGQHAHQSLIKRTVQRSLLDFHARHISLLEAVRGAWIDWHTATGQLEELSTDAKDHESTIALLQYQAAELRGLAPEPGEVERLEIDYKRLENAARLLEVSHSTLDTLGMADSSVDTQLGLAIRNLRELARFDPALEQITTLLENATIHLREGIDELRRYTDNLETDPEQLHITEARLNALHDMARKHHVSPEELPEHLRSLQDRLDHLSRSRESIGTLIKAQAEALSRYHQGAAALHESRKKAAITMSAEVSAQMQRLGMPEGKFIIDISPIDTDKPQAEGTDQIEFLVSVNPGQPPQPLRKVASGGELSRISLAIQIVSKEEKTIPTLIFDEVDAGIGGGNAEIVGKLLRDISEQHQVFCVTHLPQVASLAHHHLQVSKSTNKKSTSTSIADLGPDERVEEIARMLGGVRISEKTRAHAREMLSKP